MNAAGPEGARGKPVPFLPPPHHFHIPSILDFEPSLDALSLRSVVTSSIKILSPLALSCVWVLMFAGLGDRYQEQVTEALVPNSGARVKGSASGGGVMQRVGCPKTCANPGEVLAVWRGLHEQRV